MKKVFLLFALLLVMSVCVTLPPPPPTDSSLTIETSVRQEFQIVIEADHAGPDRWSISGSLSNVELVGSQYRPRMTKRNPRSGVEIWTFRALSAGDATITFHLETQDSPTPMQAASFTVSVK